MLRVLLYPQEQRAFIPISANQERWRSGSNSPRKTAKFAILALHLAQGSTATRAKGGATDGTQKNTDKDFLGCFRCSVGVQSVAQGRAGVLCHFAKSRGRWQST